MGKKRPGHLFSSDFQWQNKIHNRTLQNAKKQSLNANAFLYPIDESEDFYDPFSDLSLFLAKKISGLIASDALPKSWSDKVQKILQEKIIPEFEKQFPKYRLGGNALKKAFEKVHFYYQKMEKEDKAFTKDGSIDIEYMIRENLKHSPASHSLYGIHPYNYSHQLAVKISECIAMLDGIKFPLDQLTKMIWSVQKHLLPKSDVLKKAPFEQYDTIDRLMIRHMLTITHQHQNRGQKVLQENLVEALNRYSLLSSMKNLESLKPVISSLLAEMTVKNLSIFRQLSRKKIDQIEIFIQKQIKRCQEQKGRFIKDNKASIVNRILALYPIATHLTKGSNKDQLDAAIQYVYSLSSNIFAPISPVMNQALLSFINSEIVSLKEKKETGALEKVLSTLLTVFQDANDLPRLTPKQMGELEVWIWYLLNQEENSLKLPQGVKEVLEEEIAHILVEEQEMNFKSIVSKTMQFFKVVNESEFFSHFFEKTKESRSIQKLKDKAYLWSIQGDMVCSILEFDDRSFLIRQTQKVLEEMSWEAPIDEIIDTICKSHLREYPFIQSQEKTLKTHVAIIIKYLWYNKYSSSKESSYHRFIKWNNMLLNQRNPDVSGEQLLREIEERVHQSLPLIPFDGESLKHLSKKCS